MTRLDLALLLCITAYVASSHDLQKRQSFIYEGIQCNTDAECERKCGRKEESDGCDEYEKTCRCQTACRSDSDCDHLPIGNACVNGRCKSAKYIKHSSTYCENVFSDDNGDNIEKATWASALTACNLDHECRFILDGGCNNQGPFWFCPENPGLGTNRRHCIYEKECFDRVDGYDGYGCDYDYCGKSGSWKRGDNWYENWKDACRKTCKYQKCSDTWFWHNGHTSGAFGAGSG